MSFPMRGPILHYMQKAAPFGIVHGRARGQVAYATAAETPSLRSKDSTLNEGVSEFRLRFAQGSWRCLQ
jgi:hypothetical protein